MDRYLPFVGSSIGFCEESCELTNPVDVRGLDATLYDFVCRADYGDFTRRVMLLTQRDFEDRVTTSFIDENGTRRIVPCP
jgi:hypothetical protein